MSRARKSELRFPANVEYAENVDNLVFRRLYKEEGLDAWVFYDLRRTDDAGVCCEPKEDDFHFDSTKSCSPIHTAHLPNSTPSSVLCLHDCGTTTTLSSSLSRDRNEQRADTSSRLQAIVNPPTHTGTTC